jgi:hypothetical protein
MNAEQFCYWLQGVFEVTDPKTLNEKQVAIIKEHLGLVFKKETTESYDSSNQQPVENPLPFTDGHYGGFNSGMRYCAGTSVYNLPTALIHKSC